MLDPTILDDTPWAEADRLNLPLDEVPPYSEGSLNEEAEPQIAEGGWYEYS